MFRVLSIDEMMDLPIVERLEYLREEERQRELKKLKNTEEIYLTT